MRNRSKFHTVRLGALAATLLAAVAIPSLNASGAPPATDATLLASGIEDLTNPGTTIGPDGALYVTQGASGSIARVDRQTGAVTPFADGLPPAVFPVGGVADVAFVDGTAYAIVTIVGTDVGGSSIVGLYRLDGPGTWSVVADIGQWSIDNPSPSDVFIPSGVHYALDFQQGRFLVTDGHHNRVLAVTLDGQISEELSFGNVVPTGLETRGHTTIVALAGPVPHVPEDGMAVASTKHAPDPAVVANGARLLVDVEYGPGGTLFGLSQGYFEPGNGEGSPANPDTGALMYADSDGTFRTALDGLDRPTSFEIVGNTAYVVTLDGEIWQIDHLERSTR